MKRYQCIKTIKSDRGMPVFIAGKVYDKFDLDFFIIDVSLIKTHFQELLDLHVDDIPRDEADREPFTTPEPRRKLTAGWAWLIALVITIVFFVLKAFTE